MKRISVSCQIYTTYFRVTFGNFVDQISVWFKNCNHTQYDAFLEKQKYDLLREYIHVWKLFNMHSDKWFILNELILTVESVLSCTKEMLPLESKNNCKRNQLMILYKLNQIRLYLNIFRWIWIRTQNCVWFQTNRKKIVIWQNKS